MANLNFVTDRLATGGDLPYDSADALRDLNEWRRLGITHVVDNRLEWSDADFVAEWAPEINYLARDYASFRRLMLDRLSLLAVAGIGAPESAPAAMVFLGVIACRHREFSQGYLWFARASIGPDEHWALVADEELRRMG